MNGTNQDFNRLFFLQVKNAIHKNMAFRRTRRLLFAFDLETIAQRVWIGGMCGASIGIHECKRRVFGSICHVPLPDTTNRHWIDSHCVQLASKKQNKHLKHIFLKNLWFTASKNTVFHDVCVHVR